MEEVKTCSSCKIEHLKKGKEEKRELYEHNQIFLGREVNEQDPNTAWVMSSIIPVSQMMMMEVSI